MGEKMLKTLKYLTVALFGFAALITQAQAQSVSDFYNGRTVTIIYGFGSGGTYGKYALMFSEFLSKYIPGNPKIIAQSMPGAGGIKAANYAYNVMPKDGSAIFMPPDSIVITELLQPKKVKFKTDKFTWLGTAIESNSIIVIRSDSGIKDITDLKKKQIIMASTGTGSQTFLMPALLNAVYGAKFKIVSGYKGSRKSMLSMEQGETQGLSVTWLAWRSAHPEWFKPGGFAKAIVQIGYKKEKELMDVPMLLDVVKGETDKAIVSFMASLGPIGRGLATPPGVPADRVAALQAAFSKMVNDPAFETAAIKRKLRVKPLTGPQVQEMVNNVMKVSPAVVKEARKRIMGK
jgi:tripartite-type tricarboxylate transporter receptor subunit TctC